MEQVSIWHRNLGWILQAFRCKIHFLVGVLACDKGGGQYFVGGFLGEGGGGDGYTIGGGGEKYSIGGGGDKYSIGGDGV